MKKTTLFLIIGLLVSFASLAKKIDVTTAMKVAKHYYTLMTVGNNAVNKQAINLSLAYTCNANIALSTVKSAEENLYYILNVNTDDGFVIVTADDIVTPILGYSNKGIWNVSKIPPALQDLLDNYKKQIIYAINNNLIAANETIQKWNDLINTNSNFKKQNPFSKSSVQLTTADWDQGNASGYYNDLCPTDPSLPDANNNSYHCVTGCPATAMSIIMKYWSYPATGSGMHSYSTSSYGTLNADFGSTTYNWSAMPLSNLSSSNYDVATIMYQCGVGVEMNYGPDESGGYVITAENSVCSQSAFTTYFGYDPSTIQGLERSNYNDNDWITLLENELNNNRPIQYVGRGSNGGHTFVCDGYDVNNYPHFNWGWGGYCNGNFEINSLNPGGDDFNSQQEALIGIQPLNGGGTTSDIEMYSDITVTPNPINFNQAFTVNADVTNNGTSDFNGDFSAALFDDSGNFIDFIQTYTGNTLQVGYHYTGGITFSSSGILTVPGNYTIGIYYRPTGGNWYLVGASSYTNPISVTINSPGGNTNGSPNNLELYSSITPSPSTFVQGQAASVNVDFTNANNYTYYGQYEAALYDLNGNFVQTIGTYNETTGLQVNYHYNSPYITFSTSSLTASPGSYLLVIAEEEQGTTDWYYVGGDYYTNPINIDVVAAPLSPDIYEQNNTQSSAYTLPLNWISNDAHPLTTGSNLHMDTDIDYYKVNLSSGYNYTITARVDDSYNSGNGNTYTCDVLWSYDSGSGWSQTYDDIMPGNITVNGAGTVTFLVAPYYTGQTGTYLLDININRSSTGLTEIINNNVFEIFPNPAANILNLKYNGNNSFEKMKIINIYGQIITDINSSQNLSKIDVSGLANGMYFLEAIENNKIYSVKFIISR